jgi:hypothetical protein
MAKKETYCPHCQKKLMVSKRAFSVVCPFCHQRVEVEDHVIDDYYTISIIESSGSLRVARSGSLYATVKVTNLDVEGQMHGSVNVKGKVTVEPGGKLEGDVIAPRLEVKPGAKLKGFCRIEPTIKKPEPT